MVILGLFPKPPTALPLHLCKIETKTKITHIWWVGKTTCDARTIKVKTFLGWWWKTRIMRRRTRSFKKSRRIIVGQVLLLTSPTWAVIWLTWAEVASTGCWCQGLILLVLPATWPAAAVPSNIVLSLARASSRANWPWCLKTRTAARTCRWTRGRCWNQRCRGCRWSSMYRIRVNSRSRTSTCRTTWTAWTCRWYLRRRIEVPKRNE